MPSIKTNGFCPASWNVLIPRIQKEELSYPGSPERCTANTPATVPARLLLIERVVETFNLAGSIVVIEPTIDSFFCAP